MADFKVIETQEQFEEAIKARLERDRKTYRKAFEEEMRGKGWKSQEEIAELTKELTDKIETLNTAAAETAKAMAAKDEEIAAGAQYRTDLEKTRIAIAAGLKLDYVDRLRGANAEEWKADAEKLAKDFAAAHATAPLGSGEPTSSGTNNTGKQFAEWFGQQFN